MTRPWGRPAGFLPRVCTDCGVAFHPTGPEGERCRPCMHRALADYAQGAREELLEGMVHDLAATVERQGQLINRLRRELTMARITLKQLRQSGVQSCDCED